MALIVVDWPHVLYETDGAVKRITALEILLEVSCMKRMKRILFEVSIFSNSNRLRFGLLLGNSMVKIEFSVGYVV